MRYFMAYKSSFPYLTISAGGEDSTRTCCMVHRCALRVLSTRRGIFMSNSGQHIEKLQITDRERKLLEVVSMVIIKHRDLVYLDSSFRDDPEGAEQYAMEEIKETLDLLTELRH